MILTFRLSNRALSEVVGTPLPYDDVLSLRDRMWELSPTLLRYDALDITSSEIAAAGLKQLVKSTASAKIAGGAFRKPISNFYQTDVISRAYVSFTFRCRSGLIYYLPQFCYHGTMHKSLRY